MKTVSILNLKGGVGKTFTTVNMAYELWRRGYKVLLIDNDKQGNLSKAYGRYDADSLSPAAKLLSGEWEQPEKTEGSWCGLYELIQPTDYEGIDIITANMSLLGATWRLTAEETENQINRYSKLAELESVKGYYDYCIIDNPPDVGLNVVNALAITDEVIVPVKIDAWALEGLDILAEQIEDAKQYNTRLRLRGVLITAYQNTDGEAAGLEWLQKDWLEKKRTGQRGYQILGVIRYSKKVAESTFLFKPIYEYSPCCGAAQSYKKFITEYTGKAR